MDMPWSPQPKPPKRSPARRNAVPIVSIIGDEDEFIVRRRRRPPPVEEPPPPPPEKPTWLSKGARDRARAALEAELAHHAEEYLELAFEAEAEGIDGPRLDAASTFDGRYKGAAGTAHAHLVDSVFDPSGKGSAHIVKQIRELRYAAKYFVPERVEMGFARPPKVAVRRRKPVARWQLPTSCWKPRLDNEQSRSFFETPDALKRMFDLDWQVACKGHDLSMYIVKCHRDPSTWRDIDANGVHDEVDEVRDALYRHAHLIYGAYDYYASLHSDYEPIPGEPDVYNVTFTAFMTFARHCELFSKRTPPETYELIWSVVNADDRTAKAEGDLLNDSKYLNRQEFLQCLVRMAIAYYVHGGQCTDVSDAVGQFMTEKVGPHLPAEAVQSSNAFRKRFCYTERTSRVLEAHLPSLRSLYDQYAEASHDMRDRLADDDLMSIGEWLYFVKHLGLVDGGQVTVLLAKQIFLWSRIRSLHSRTEKAERRLRHMTFEDFMEAVVRLSIFCSMPTDDDLAEAGAADAGDYLLALQANDPKSYPRFLRKNRPRFSDPDGSDYDKHALQPAEKALFHFIKLLVKTVEHATSARNDLSLADGTIQASEAARFLKARKSGAQLQLEHAASLLGAVDFESAMENAALRAVMTAASIKIQMMCRLRDARKRIAERRAAKEDTDRLAREQQEAVGGAAKEEEDV